LVAALSQPKQTVLLEDGAEPAPVARVYRVPSLEQYGEQGQRVEGIELVSAGAVLERVSTRTAHWRMKPNALTPFKTGPGRGGRG